MGSPRGKAKGRREPRFDAFPVPGLNLRPSLRDRPAGPPPEETERARRAPAKRKDSKQAASEKPRPRAHGSEDKGETRPARKRGGGGSGGKRRSFFGRLVYWGVVLGLWACDRRGRRRSCGSPRICRRSNRWRSPSARPRCRSSD